MITAESNVLELLKEAFEKNGWKMYHKFHAGPYWVKGDDTVTYFLGRFGFNGVPVDRAFVHKMVHLEVDRRLGQVCEAIVPHPINSRYGQAFLAGVRWADGNRD